MAAINGLIIFLDLDRDRYYCLPGKRLGATPRAQLLTLKREKSAQAVLRNRGLVADERASGQPMSFTDYPLPTADVPHSGISVNLLNRRKVVAGLNRADRILSARPIAHIVRERRERCSVARTGGSDDAKAIRRAIQFEIWRPSISRVDQCLADSLALLEFLEGNGHTADWVFAVTAPPFAAHCWVQIGSTVLNDTLDHARLYVPIMVA